MLQSINPANLEVLNTYQQMQPSEVSKIIDLTNTAFENWRETSFTHRVKTYDERCRGVKKK